MGEGSDEVSVTRFTADQKTFWKVPVAACCALLGVSVSWFYKWRERSGRRVSDRLGEARRRS